MERGKSKESRKNEVLVGYINAFVILHELIKDLIDYTLRKLVSWL